MPVSLATKPTPQVREIRMVDGLAGFPGAARFALAPLGDDPKTSFSVLRSLDVPHLAFVVVRPEVFFPGYDVELDDAVRARLELPDPSDALVLTIVTVGERPQDSTANLLGPIVINLRTMTAAQVALDPDVHAARRPLLAGLARAGG